MAGPELPDPTAHALRALIHSVNNILATVSGQAQVLAMRVARSDAPAEVIDDVAERTARIRQSVERCERYLGRFRGLYRTPSGAPMPTSLASLVEEALGYVGPEAATRVACVGPADLVLRVDPGAAGLALSEMLHNGLLAGEPGSRVELVATTDGEWAEVTVVDFGRGAEPEVLARAFELFYSGWREHEQPGIGLCLARSAAEATGATIELTSEGAGKGARCVLRAPVA